MSRFLSAALASLVVAAVVTVCRPASSADPNPALLKPSLAAETAPESYKVKFETTKGDFVIEVTRAWAPNGADRFYNLVKIGYYDGAVFFRVIDGFMAQVGMHGDPAVQAAWMKASIPDDPPTQSNTRGMVTFAAQGAPNSRTTQFFINFGDNSYLKQYGPFAPFGRVVEGLKVVDSLYSGYGEGAPKGRGPSQGEIARQGNAYLKASFPELDAITRASLLAP
ncbi:MAG: peptidylprolyl isomerase [Holophagae bacterium]|nr:MAG: peptidylprolyl isomerase [Holophagae bacterium]